ncbi:MAG: hypothetical protein HY713_09150 [candidate division NC10 bacterium]|nr:hypothetical protein [candidate division NC10 bacterium]
MEGVSRGHAMDRNRRQTPSKWTLAAQILAERRAIQGRLASLDRRGAIGSLESLSGDKTRTSEVMEGVQESVWRATPKETTKQDIAATQKEKWWGEVILVEPIQ